MLVLADADGLWVNLDQFGQRVLQATADRGSAAQTHIQIGKFSGRQRGGGIHRGARFGHHHFGQLQLGVAFDQLGGEAVGLARGGAIADGDQIGAVLLGQAGHFGQGTVPVAARFVRVDGGGVDQLAGAIDHGHLDAGAQARIEADGDTRAGRGGEQQILEVAGEDADGLFFGALA